MAISENIQVITERISDEINNSPDGHSDTAWTVHGLAMNAILGGIEDWVNYMKMFANSPAELARLIPTEIDPEDKVEERRSARAYLAANGMCTEATTPNMQMRVTTDLDGQ